MGFPVQVVTRVRPPSSSNPNSKESCVQVAPASSQIILGYDQFCDFDAVFGPDISQKELYMSCLTDKISNFFEGYNVTIVSYGQKSSGKSYTITGPDFLWAMNEEEFGLLPRAVRHVFNLMKDNPGREYRVHVSYLVVQRENVFDLLSTTNGPMQLNVLDDNMGNVVIPGLNVVDCSNITEVINCLEAGLLRRHSSMVHNVDQSAMHAIFSFVLEHQWTDEEGKLQYLYSRMSFIDLGGTQEMSNFGFNDYDPTTEEAFFHNSDLQALSRVIHCLSDRTYQGVIPYRESVLTHLLKDAFGGNSITLMVCCISPHVEDYASTLTALKYGGMARYIINCPNINMVIQCTSQQSVTSTPISNQTIAETSLSHPSTAGTKKSNISRPVNTPGNYSENQYSLEETNNNTNNNNVNNNNSLNCNNNNSVSNNNNNVSQNNSQEIDEAFRYQFAASQWQLLVSSAESLLTKMLHSDIISDSDKAEVESWLCMKAEADECIGLDLLGMQNDQGSQRLLDVIEELSEPSEAVVDNDINRNSDDCSTNESLGDDFYDNLHRLESRFSTMTSDLVSATEELHDDIIKLKKLDRNTYLRCSKSTPCKMSTTSTQTSSYLIENKMDKGNSNRNERRKSSSSLDGIKEIDNIRNSISSSSKSDSIDDNFNKSLEKSDSNFSINASSSSESVKIKSDKSKKKKSNNSSNGDPISEEITDLINSQDTRHSQVLRLGAQLKATQHRLKELTATIQVKEAFICELAKSGNDAEITKRKCDKKISLLEREIEKAKQKLDDNDDEIEDEITYKMREELNRQININQKKLSSLKKIMGISQHANSKLAELEKSVKEMKQQKDQLTNRLKDEISFKENLEKQIIRDQRRIKQLDQMTQDTKDIETSIDNVSLDKFGSQVRLTDSIKSESRSHKTILKTQESLHRVKKKLQNSFLLGDRGSSQEKQNAGENGLRQEINLLREVRDNLLQRRKKLDNRIHKHSKEVGCSDERKLIEIDEAIEAIDSTIEHKNELLCGRPSQLPATTKLLKQDNLLNSLLTLNSDELRSLMLRYFNRVVDLRIEFRKQEVVFSDVEHKCDEQVRYIGDMKAAYQQASLDMERRIIQLQRDYQQKISTLLKQFNDDSPATTDIRLHDLEQQLFYYKKLSHDLKYKVRSNKDHSQNQRYQEILPSTSRGFESVMDQSYQNSPVLPNYTASNRTHGSISQRRLAVAGPSFVKKGHLVTGNESRETRSPLTQITRERNKIIIQHHKSDKHGKHKT